MTPQEFRATYRPQALAVAKGTGLLPDALICQWGVETAWGTAINNQNNLANIRCLQSVPCVNGFAQFPSLDSFVQNCVAVWRDGNYDAVLAAAGKSLLAELLAIGQSPWDAGHYNNGGGPGSSLVTAARQLGLLQRRQTAVVMSTKSLHQFIRGADGALWHRQIKGGVIGGWVSLGGQLMIGTDPEAGIDDAGNLLVTVVGTDAQFYDYESGDDGAHFTFSGPHGAGTGLFEVAPISVSGANIDFSPVLSAVAALKSDVDAQLAAVKAELDAMKPGTDKAIKDLA